MTGTRRWLPVCIALALLTGTSVVVGAAEESAGAALSRMTMSLTRSHPYRFVLAYRGRTMPFRGHLCYWFAGYNETCLDPQLEWLTPATEIELYAPGGVPRDLLAGYVMLVRYPALSERIYPYRLGAGP